MKNQEVSLRRMQIESEYMMYIFVNERDVNYGSGEIRKLHS
jgi:hypothetical protein